MAAETFNILETTCQEFAGWLESRFSKGPYHAEALYRQVFGQARLAPQRLEAFEKSGCLAQQVAKAIAFDPPRLAASRSRQGVTKLVFRLADGIMIESVVLPMATHFTLCVSTQAGCRMGCRFCRTGQMGLLRNLTAAEIVGQVLAARVRLGFDIRNLVFMGMGEPLDNFGNFVKAVRVLEDQRGLNIAQSRMTVSTAGLVDKIRRLAELGWKRLKLAVSLNAPDDRLRSFLMPVNRRHPLPALMAALKEYPLPPKGHVLLEYVLMAGINDSERHAAALAGLVADMPVKINLIACNPAVGDTFRRPTADGLERFRDLLVARRLFVRIRPSRGCGILAACGQLGGVQPPARSGASLGPGAGADRRHCADLLC